MNECFGCSTCKSADKPLEKYIAGLPWKLPTTEWRARVRSAVSACRASVAVFVPTAPAVLPRKRPEVSAERRRT